MTDTHKHIHTHTLIHRHKHTHKQKHAHIHTHTQAHPFTYTLTRVHLCISIIYIDLCVRVLRAFVCSDDKPGAQLVLKGGIATGEVFPLGVTLSLNYFHGVASGFLGFSRNMHIP